MYIGIFYKFTLKSACTFPVFEKSGITWGGGGVRSLYQRLDAKLATLLNLVKLVDLS